MALGIHLEDSLGGRVVWVRGRGNEDGERFIVVWVEAGADGCAIGSWRAAVPDEMSGGVPPRPMFLGAFDTL